MTKNMVNDILTMWVNTYIMALFTALMLFAIGGIITYAMVRYKDHENDE